MVSLTSILTNWLTTRHYVRLKEPPPPALQTMAGHIGIIDRIDMQTGVGKDKNIPNGNILVRFIVDGQERLFQTRAAYFDEILKSEVPPDLVKAFEQHRVDLEAAMAKAQSDFNTAEKQRQKEANEAQANLEKIFEKSRTFWKNWKGPEGAEKMPRSSDDPEGVDASNRPTPKIT